MSLLWVTAIHFDDDEDYDESPYRSPDGTYFHGTTHEFKPGEHVLPASGHGKGSNFGESDQGYAYATGDPDNGWHYGESAWDGHGPEHPDFHGHPRVYRVRPLGPVEKDPEYDERGRHRGNFSTDVRSKHGFEVLDELPMPENYGSPEDWR